MTEKEEMKKWITLILIAVISYFLINNFTTVLNILGKIINVLLPFILGGVLAFILNIPMTKIENILLKKIKNKKYKSLVRIISIILSLLLFILVIGFISFLLIPELVENIEALITNIPNLVSEAEDFILNLLDQHPSIQVEIEKMFTSINTSSLLADALNYIVNGSLSFISSFISSIITLFTAIIFSIYMLTQKEYLIKGVKKVSFAYLNKEKANKLIEVGSLANKTFSKFISGQCVDAIILGIILFIVLSLFKFPYALLISVLTCITALIPIFGALIAMAVGAILIAITSPLEALLFIVIFQIVQQIEGNFIYPRIVGSSVGLSPLWTLFAITVGGSLFGVVGMIIGLPLASIAYAILRSNVNNKITEKNISI